MLPFTGPACYNQRLSLQLSRAGNLGLDSDYHNVVLEIFLTGAVSTGSGNAFMVELCDFMVGVYDMETCRNL